MFARMWPGRARPVQAWRAQNESAALYGRSRRGHLIACREGTSAASACTHRRFAIHTIIECEYGSRAAKSKPSNPISSRSSAVKSTLRKTPNPPTNYVKHTNTARAPLRHANDRATARGRERDLGLMLGGLDGRKHPSGHIQFGLSHNKHGAQLTRSAEHVFRIRWLGGGPCATCRPRA